MKAGIDMGFSLNKVVKPQTIELNKKANIFSNEHSPTKRNYVEGHKPDFNRHDIITLIKNLKKVYNIPYTLYKTVKLIKKNSVPSQKLMSVQKFDELIQMLTELQVDDLGYFEVTPEKLFKNCGVPYKYALVFSTAMDKKAFADAPSIECQLEVARVYAVSGNVANRVSEFLQKNGFGACPNHSMGGQLDYSMAAEWAGIAMTGRHSMAITKKNGACNRISVVYTNIENLGEIIKSAEDMTWIRGFCEKCGKCVRKCPTAGIYEKPVILDGVNPTRVDYEKCCEGFLKYGCGVCIKECPFTSGNYEKIKKAYKKEVRR
jgi:epoxyqueuosine reductase